jgi:hypothetical protein
MNETQKFWMIGRLFSTDEVHDLRDDELFGPPKLSSRDHLMSGLSIDRDQQKDYDYIEQGGKSEHETTSSMPTLISCEPETGTLSRVSHRITALDHIFAEYFGQQNTVPEPCSPNSKASCFCHIFSCYKLGPGKSTV